MKTLTRSKNNLYGLFSGHCRAKLDNSVLSSQSGVTEHVRRQNLSKGTQSVDSEEIFQNIGLCI